MSVRNYSNTAATSTLSAPIGATDTSFTLTGYSGDPTPPFTAALARGTATEEVVLVTGVVGSTVTVTRGYDGTAAQAQSSGATFQEVVAALDFREANNHVNSGSSGAHGTTSQLVGVSDTQTLTNKTLTSPTITNPSVTGTATVATVNVTTLTVSGVSSLASLSTSGNASVGGTFGVTGAATLSSTLAVTGAITATGGVTGPAAGQLVLTNGASVPTGKKLTITDAPTLSTDAANQGYVSGLATIAGASRALVAAQGSGSAFPSTNLKVGDVFLRSDLGTNGSLWQYVGGTNGASGWVTLEAPLVCTSSTRPATAYPGLLIFETDTGRQWRYPISGSTWVYAGGAPPPVVALTLLGGWNPVSGNAPGVYMDTSGIVHLVGAVTNVSTYSPDVGADMGTLPTGYRPAYTRTVGVAIVPPSPDQAVWVSVNSSGTVRMVGDSGATTVGAGSGHYLESISFHLTYAGTTPFN